VAIFLNGMTGSGLLCELDRHAGADEDTRTDDEVRQAAALLNRMPSRDSVELDGPEKDEDNWREVQDARDERVLVFDQWRRAVASLHRAHRLLAPFPWLRPWSDARMRQKAAYVALLPSIVHESSSFR
jgi:hypothetical protein